MEKLTACAPVVIMLGAQLLRTPLRRGATLASARVPAVARGYASAVTAEQVPEVDPSILSQKVEMTPMEAGKGHYIDYKRIYDNLQVIKKRLNRPLTMSEKILYGHLDNPHTAEIERGVS